jgi:PAS domain S-box-containing protein
VRIEIASDITERKKVQEALAESESFNRGLVENLPDYIAVYGMDGKLLYVNPASARTLGYDAETLIGTHVLSYIAEEYHKTVIAKMTVRKEGGEAPPYEIELVTRNGPRRSVIVKATPIKYQNNPAILLLLIDITDRKRAEEALILANKKLNLLSSITRHDITNQLSVLQGYIRILEKKQPDTMHNEYFQKIATAAQRISSMIQFTREYEKIGVSTPVWQDCRSLADTAAREAPLGKIVLKNDLPDGTEVFADPLIVKVFYNVMDNAVRYGGKITIIRFAVEEAGDEHRIVCEDDGDGVVAGEKEQIFERGFGKNTGLGLALSREILSITGITIKETGEPGKGARFEMTVPKGAWRIAGKDTQ